MQGYLWLDGKVKGIKIEAIRIHAFFQQTVAYAINHDWRAAGVDVKFLEPVIGSADGFMNKAASAVP